MELRPRPGVAALMEECGGGAKRMSATTVGFTLAPRIKRRPAGWATPPSPPGCCWPRRWRPPRPWRESCAASTASGRRRLEHGIWEQAAAYLRERPPEGPIVLASEGWHQGVIGIAASRLAEEFRRPCVMICFDGGMGKGSCRSYGGFNLFDALSACSGCLEGFGGHALAAGLTIRRERLDDFRRELAEYYRRCPPPAEPALECDVRIDDPDWLSMDCAASLERLEPCGAGNPRPVVCMTGALLTRVTPIGGGSHLKLRLAKGGAEFDCVFFGCRAEQLGAEEGELVDAGGFTRR